MSVADELRRKAAGASGGYTVADDSGLDDDAAKAHSQRERAMRVEPEPLRRSVPPAAAYPVDALGSLLGDAAKALHDHIRAPLALCGQSVLAAASLAVQSHGDVVIDGRRFPTTLWAITIAESGERKSAVDAVALAAHKRHERELLKVADEAEPRYQVELAAYEAAMKQAKNKKTRADITSAIEACGQPPAPPPRGILLAAEPTVEAIQKIYLTGVGSLGLFSDEGAVFFGGHSMSADHALRSIGALSKLWDDGTSDRLRATDGQRKLYGRRLAMHMLVQPVVAEGILSNPLLSGQGFLARCLIAWPATTAGSRLYVEADPYKAPAVCRFSSRMTELLQLEPQLQDGRRGELSPPALTLTSSAKATWLAAYEQFEKHMAPTGGYAQVRPWASKAADMVLRIAGVLTLVENPRTNTIDADTVVRATKLMAWHMTEVLRLVDVARVPVEVHHAEAILNWCRIKGLSLVDATTLLNKGPNATRSKETLDPAMAVLIDRGWAEPQKNVVLGDRKVKRAWAIHLAESQESQKSPR